MIETGIYFGEIHSYHDLNLILSSVTIPPAKPKTNYIDIPGGDGSIDLTEAHGEIKYNDRECTFTFTVAPGDGLTFEERKTKVSNALNGLKCRITLDKDSSWYYNGRLNVDEYKQDKNLLQITVSARVEPYKYKLSETVVTYAINADEEKLFLIRNARKSVVPIIVTDVQLRITFEDAVFNLNPGTHRILEINLKSGDNPFKMMGVGAAGKVSFTFQEGAL